MTIDLKYKNVKIYYRDINMKEEVFNFYQKKMIVFEKQFTDITNTLAGPFTSHRYIFITDKAQNMDKYKMDENWNLHIIERDSYFKIIEITKIKNITYLIMLHIEKEDIDFFKKDNKYEKKFIKMAFKQIKNDNKKQPSKELATISWLEKCIRPIGYL